MWDPAFRLQLAKMPSSWEDRCSNCLTIARYRGLEVSVGASVGIAVFPEDAPDTESLCIAADLQMYNSKRRSRNQIRMRPP